MRGKKGLTAGLICLIKLILFGLHIPSAAADSSHRVFILHSYEQHHVCGQPQHDGVVEALKDAGFREEDDLLIDSYYMDTKRNNNTPELIEVQARIAARKIRAFRPHVLVTLDDNAFRSVALSRIGSDIPVVFSGMNGQPEEYNEITPFMKTRSRPGGHITGVYEKLHIVDAIRVHSRLFPGLKKIKIYVDASPTGRAIAKQIEIEIKREPVPCLWEMKTIKSWESYQEEILAVNNEPDIGAIYPAVLLLKDRRAKTYTAPEIFAWTVQNSKKTEIPLNYSFTRMGLFGGAAVDFFAMGYQAGEMVARILRGTSPGSIAIQDAQRYALVFNLTRAQQLDIQLPSDVLLAADEVITKER